ncbi:ABC transporter permease [Geosporobacter ferrireducens]|uniref:ABC transporter permease n=1 Tax=Geosporobacter ferrireducens TaxID=1424294 RepID=UPI00139EB550|nr:ABC transporter permease [Geosporobacter ferrireducens]MTI55944.1 ABC transporter permease [Geosporobacter ferrireducens]
MAKYLLRRLFISMLTILVLITAVWILVRLLPGDPFTSDKLSPEIKENIMRYYGFDKPLITQYITYLKNLLRGDLGYSLNYKNLTVTRILKDSFPYSADLGVRALLFAVLTGLFLGIVAALNRSRFLDYFCIIIAIIGCSVPDFIIGSLLQYVFGVKLKLLPVAQWQGFKYTILPSVALGFYTLAYVSRVMRASMLEVVNQDYIKTANSKGLSQIQVIFGHQIRNAILPVITVLGPIIAAILTGTFVIESIYTIPGMGKYYVSGVQTLDYTLILGSTIFYGVLLVIANTVVDIAYGIIDPRIRVYKK